MTKRHRATVHRGSPAFLLPSRTLKPPGGYRVVLISPTSTDLPGAHGEVLAAMEYGDRVIPVQHPVTAAAALRVLEETGGGSDVVWFFSTHSRANASELWESGIQMDDGELTASTLATYAKLYKPALVYLNSCQSQQIMKLICEYAGTDGICTEVDVPDELAYTTGKLFLKQLFTTGDTRAAYDLSRPANNRTYVYISGFRDNTMAPQLSGDYAELKHISDKIEALDRAIRGDDYGADGLIAEFRQFKSDLLRYMDERRAWEHTVEGRLSRIESEQQDVLRWRNQQVQPKVMTVSSYIQVLLFVAVVIFLQLFIAWSAANFFR